MTAHKPLLAALRRVCGPFPAEADERSYEETGS